MNYQLHYNRLIDRAWERSLEGYHERHHVIPKCVGGSNAKANIVKLTPEEHYVAHQLLVRLYPQNRKLIHAATMMAKRCSGKRAYGWLRRAFSEAQKGNRLAAGRVWTPEMRAKVGDALRGIPKSPEHRAKIISRWVRPDNRGKCLSETTKEKLRQANLGKTMNAETREKISKALIGRSGPNLGQRLPPEVRQRISASLTGLVRSPETRAKMSSAQRGNSKALGLKRGPQSEEHKAKRKATLECKRRLAKEAKQPSIPSRGGWVRTPESVARAVETRRLKYEAGGRPPSRAVSEETRAKHRAARAAQVSPRGWTRTPEANAKMIETRRRNKESKIG